MSAPQGSYFSKKLNIKPFSTSDENVFVAKYFKNTVATTGTDWGDGYFNVSDDDATKKSKILSIFKLDDLLRVKTTVGEGFIGRVNAAGSNATFHNANRVSKGRVEEDGLTYYVFNDGGLNRKPEAYIGNTLNEPKWANWINLPVEIRNAFYNKTTAYGYSYSINGGSWTDVAIGEGLGYKTISERLIRQINLTPTLEEGDTVSFKSLATNEEGTDYSTAYTFTALETIYSTGANELPAPDGQLGDGIYIYGLSSTESALLTVTDSDAATGIYLYNSEYFNSSNYLANGYYIIGGVPTLNNGNIKVFKVQSGEVRQYIERVPVTPILRLQVVNLGMMDLPEYRAQATALDTTEGFVATLTLNIAITYQIYSGGTYSQTGESVYRTLSLVDGEFSSLGGILPLPPANATHTQVTTSTTVTGMTISSPYVAITL